MKIIGFIFLFFAALLLLFLFLSYICYLLVFHTAKRKPVTADTYNIPPGEIYEPFRDQMISWIKEARSLPQEEFSIQSFDGLTLRGKYYEYAPGAPIELMMHGYRGEAERDLCGGVQRCFSVGRSALVVNQRGCGNSDGNTISFGINERKDCHAWVEFMVNHFGPDVRIILTGISMGASTVIMAAGEELPQNIIGVLADCGFTSAPAIIKKVMRQIHLPANLLYPLTKWGARIYGGFDLEETSALEALQHCKVPVIFFHGDNDDFVPCEMSRQNFEACPTRKQLVTIQGAGHGLSYPVNPEQYLEALRNFFA